MARGQRKATEARAVCARSAFDSAFAVRTQIQRLRDIDNSSHTEYSRRTSDAQFLVVALWRLRMAGEMCRELVEDGAVTQEALDVYDAALPRIQNLRHVLMHYDNYGLANDNRRNIDPKSERLYGPVDVLGMGVSPDAVTWLGVEYNLDATDTAAAKLYGVVTAELGESGFA